MKFARYLAHGQVSYGVVDGTTLREITTSPFEEYRITDHTHDLSQVKLLVPTEPTKILAVGLNYSSHIAEGEREAPKEPLIFIKTPSALIVHRDAIIRPKNVPTVEEEGEMVIVIKTPCKNTSKEDALNHVLGYTCGNDVSAREWQHGDGQWWRAKSFDTFAAVGPYISDEVDPRNTMVRARINGKEVQAESTSHLIHDVPTIISWVSRHMTLEPGDLIYTGTPGDPAKLDDGDVVEVEVEGVGVLSNPVKTEE